MIEDLYMGPFVGGGFIFLLGIWFFKQAIQDFRNYKHSKNWPSVMGRMIKSEVWRPKSTSSHHVWSVEYEYKVDDKSYKGSRASLYTPLLKEIQEWQKTRQKGDDVAVYFEPATPSNSVLITGGREEKKYGEIILSICALIIGIVVMIAGGIFGYLS